MVKIRVGDFLTHALNNARFSAILRYALRYFLSVNNARIMLR